MILNIWDQKEAVVSVTLPSHHALFYRNTSQAGRSNNQMLWAEYLTAILFNWFFVFTFFLMHSTTLGFFVCFYKVFIHKCHTNTNKLFAAFFLFFFFYIKIYSNWSSRYGIISYIQKVTLKPAGKLKIYSPCNHLHN